MIDCEPMIDCELIGATVSKIVSANVCATVCKHTMYFMEECGRKQLIRVSDILEDVTVEQKHCKLMC